MAITRTNLFVIIAFVLFLLAAFVGGGLITSSFFKVDWLVPGGLASYMLALLV